VLQAVGVKNIVYIGLPPRYGRDKTTCFLHAAHHHLLHHERTGHITPSGRYPGALACQNQTFSKFPNTCGYDLHILP
jgi:hypothetical protein